MRTLTFVLTLSLFVFTNGAQASGCPPTNVIDDPVPFDWTDAGGYWTGTLEIGEATLNVGTGTLTTRAYRQAGGTFSIPGPTMNMTPGQTYVLTLKNTLPDDGEPSPVHNAFKDPNITNIHTHGLHVSGETPADDVIRVINGQHCGDYVYEIPADHMGGTLWYHPHYHGSTYLQVATGAFGLLVVDDSGDGIPTEVAGMTERQLAIGFIDPSVAGTGGDTLVSGSLSPTWTVNGKVQGNLCTPANEWQHWRVLLADRDARMKTLSVEPTDACDVALLTRDGVWRTVAPLDLSTNAVALTGASRADLAVRCSADATINVNGTPVANVLADGSVTPNTDVGPYEFGSSGGTWEATRPDYLQDLTGIGLDNVEQQSIRMGARTINGDKFDPDVPTFQLGVGYVQEWNLKGATNHPFHQHVYHMQVNGACGDFEDGEYYDTIAANCDVRFNLNPDTSSVYYGRTIMHCHILEHEDQGAMGWSEVLGGISAPAFPDPTSQQVLYECGDTGAPPDPPDPPTVCGSFLDRDSCRAESTCKWVRNTECVAK